MSIINKTKGEKYGINQNQYYLTEFDLVNVTGSPVSYDLFNTTTLSQVQTTPAPTLPPSVVGTPITIPNPASWVLYCPTNNTIFAFQGTTQYTVIDCNTNTSIFTGGGLIGAILDVEYNSANNFVYVRTWIPITAIIYVIDCSTNLVVATIVLPASGIGYFALNTLNNTIYYGRGGTSLGILDCNTNTIIATIPTLLTAIRGLAYNTITNLLYVVDSATNSVSILDCNTNIFIGLPIAVGIGCFEIFYCPSNNSMYVGNIGSNDVSVIDCNTNTVVATIPLGATPDTFSFNSQLNIIYVSCSTSNVIIEIDANTNTIVSTISVTSPFSSAYNTLSNTLYASDTTANSIGFISPAVTTTTYIGGSFNYNDFVRDLLYNPVNVKQFMLYSNNIANINQVIYATTKDANGKAFFVPKFPALSLNVNQFQASVSKIDFGNRGFTLDANTSLSNFTIQGQSSIKLILVQQQLEKSKLLTKTDNFDLFRNKVKPINGNKFDNLVPLSKVSIKDFFYQVKNDM